MKNKFTAEEALKSVYDYEEELIELSKKYNTENIDLANPIAYSEKIYKSITKFYKTLEYDMKQFCVLSKYFSVKDKWMVNKFKDINERLRDEDIGTLIITIKGENEK